MHHGDTHTHTHTHTHTQTHTHKHTQTRLHRSYTCVCDNAYHTHTRTHTDQPPRVSVVAPVFVTMRPSPGKVTRHLRHGGVESLIVGAFHLHKRTCCVARPVVLAAPLLRALSASRGGGCSGSRGWGSVGPWEGARGPGGGAAVGPGGAEEQGTVLVSGVGIA